VCEANRVHSVGDRETVYVRGTEVLRSVIVRVSCVLYIMW